MKSKNNSTKNSSNKKQKNTGSTSLEINDNNVSEILTTQEESTSYSKQAIDLGGIPKEMNIEQDNLFFFTDDNTPPFDSFACGKFEKEIHAKFIKNVETHEEMVKEILIKVIQNPQKKRIPFDQKLDEKTLKSINEKYEKIYFSIILKQDGPRINITSELSCIELAKELGIEVNNPLPELNNSVAISGNNTTINDAVKIILMEIIKAPSNTQVIVIDGTFAQKFINDINQQHKEYFKIGNNKRKNCIVITNFNRQTCLILATQLGLKIAEPNFDQISVSQPSSILFSESNSDTQAQILTVPESTLQESECPLKEILNLEDHSHVDNSSRQKLNLEIKSSDNRSTNMVSSRDKDIDEDLKYVLTKIAQSNSKYIQITKDEVKNIKNRLHLNETYKHCFHISNPQGGLLKIINQAECQKLIESMGIVQATFLVSPNQSTQESSMESKYIDEDLKYVLTKIAQSNSKYTQITKDEVKNIKNRQRLNETYKHCFHISNYRGGSIEIINQAECQKLIEKMGIARTSSLAQPNQSTSQVDEVITSVAARQTPTIPYEDSSQFRFSFATPKNTSLSSEDILEIDKLLG